MDSLALLCNLYGDGPATVRRLREAGLGSLESIDQAEPEKLAGLLRTSMRSALRFQTEGRLLLERTTGAVERSAAPVEPETPTDPVLRKVLDTWRRMDAEDAAGAEPEPELEPEAETETDERIPQPTGHSEGPGRDLHRCTALEALDLDGLDARTVADLARAGLTTLEDLALGDALTISSESGLAYTRLLRLQLLARRRLAARSPEQAVQDHGILHPSPPPEPTGPLPAVEITASAQPTDTEQRFSPAEGPPPVRPAPLEPVVRRRVDRRAAADAPEGAEEGLDSAGPFA